METTRVLYVIVDLPGQEVSKTLADHGLTDYCVSAAAFRTATGAPQLELDGEGKVKLAYSKAGAKSAREMFEKALMLRLEAGDPTVVLGATGKHGLKLLRQLNPALGYQIRLVDFAAPLLAANREQLEWQTLRDAMKEAEKEGVPIREWLEDRMTVNGSDYHVQASQGAIKLLKRRLDKRFPGTISKVIGGETAILDALDRYDNAPWADQEWEALTPEQFFAEVDEPLRFQRARTDSDFGTNDQPLLIIGDVHGDADDLAEILAAHPHSDITLLGDYFDRGPQNVAVFKLLTSQINRLRLLCGNHELALRKALVEGRGMTGGIEQETVTQFAEAGITTEEVQAFIGGLGTYHAVKYRMRKLLMSHAGVEPGLVAEWSAKSVTGLRIALAPTEVFVYGAKAPGTTAYDRDIDMAWTQSEEIDWAVSIHGHRNQFDHTVLSNADREVAAVNLADSNTTTIRYLEIEGKGYALHIRKRFSDQEVVMRGQF
ncbi:metallophosphoesterase [Lacticaseibacillus parakribbianus]|uniref:metallophosphoesterase n=1 Tax=Lacticaseibacillus parakribbianus TaxID=2970927 RepID=UPI0021CB6C84|nr:metallophosphoesterase [Lacticaseibacillus parakribbianus]